MSDEGSGGVFTADDDGFHTHLLSDRWWETETAWFSFHDPARRLGGWLYSMFRPNIGTVAGGVWIWDDSAQVPWEVPYSVNYTALHMPTDADLRDVTLPTGVSIRVLEPTRSYQLSYDDGDRLALSLRFDGVMAPQPLTAVGSTFGSAHHFDQIGHVHGRLVLHGERIDIDCLGMRDRTWGPRPEHRPRQAAYVTGAVDEGHGFLAVTNGSAERDPIAYGFLRRDGETADLVAGERLVERDPDEGWVTKLTIEATDVRGRVLRAVGEPVSRIIINRHTFIDINSLVRWYVDDEGAGGDTSGQVAWGEDQDMWPVHAFSARQRAARAARGGFAGGRVQP